MWKCYVKIKKLLFLKQFLDTKKTFENAQI